jgi:hypothetical protein
MSLFAGSRGSARIGLAVQVRPEAGSTDSVPPRPRGGGPCRPAPTAQPRHGALTAWAGFVRSEEAICCTTEPMRVPLPGGDDSNSEAEMSDSDSGGGAAAPRVAAVACGSDFSLIHLASGEVLRAPPLVLTGHVSSLLPY